MGCYGFLYCYIHSVRSSHCMWTDFYSSASSSSSSSFFFFDKSIIIKLIRKFWSTLNTCVSSFSTCDANWFYNVIFWTHFFEFRRLMIPVGRSEMRKTRHIFHLMNDSTKFYMHIRTNFSYSFGTNPKSNPTPKFVLFLATCMVPKPKLRQKLSSKI